MKIIKHGKIKRKEDEKITCPNCQCVFTYTYSDIKAEDRPCSMPYVVCPEIGCGHRVDTMKSSIDAPFSDR